jgi:hypothetical protein
MSNLRKLRDGIAIACLGFTVLGVVLPRKVERHDDEPMNVVMSIPEIQRAVWDQIRRVLRVEVHDVLPEIEEFLVATVTTAQCGAGSHARCDRHGLCVCACHELAA